MTEEERLLYQELLVRKSIADVIQGATGLFKNHTRPDGFCVGSIIDSEIKPIYSRLMDLEARKAEADVFEGLPIFMKLAESALAMVFLYQYLKSQTEADK